MIKWFNSLSFAQFFVFSFLFVFAGVGTGILVSYATNPEVTSRAFSPELKKIDQTKEYISNFLD